MRAPVTIWHMRQVMPLALLTGWLNGFRDVLAHLPDTAIILNLLINRNPYRVRANVGRNGRIGYARPSLRAARCGVKWTYRTVQWTAKTTGCLGCLTLITEVIIYGPCRAKPDRSESVEEFG